MNEQMNANNIQESNNQQISQIIEIIITWWLRTWAEESGFRGLRPDYLWGSQPEVLSSPKEINDCNVLTQGLQGQ